MISTMQPTETILKQEQNSPNSLSNISSPNTATNFSPNQQQQQQPQQHHVDQQQQGQVSQNGTTPMSSSASSGIGMESNASANSHSIFSYYGGGGTGASPTEASTASDPGGTTEGHGGCISSSTSINGNNGSCSSVPAVLRSTANTSTTLEEEFSTVYGSSNVNHNVANGNGDNGMSALNPGSASATVMSAASSVSSASINGGNGFLSNGMINGMSGVYFNPADSPTKQQQFQQQNFQQQQYPIIDQQQQQQQKFFLMSNPSCSTTPTPGALPDGTSPLPFSFNTSYSMPQSVPSSTQRIRNPFEEEEEEELLYKQTTSTASVSRCFSANPMSTSSADAVLPSPSFMDFYRKNAHQRSVKLPNGPVQTPQDFQLSMERVRLPYVFAAETKRQLPVQYPTGCGVPNINAPMPMLVRMPPHHSMLGSYPPGMMPFNSMAMALGRKTSLPLIQGPNGLYGNAIPTQHGIFFVTQNNGAIPISLNNPICQILLNKQMLANQALAQQQQHHQQQQQNQSNPVNSAASTSAPPKKEPKKKKEPTKKQQQALLQQQQQQQEAATQQQAAAATAAAATSGPMMNGGILLPDPNAMMVCGNFSPGCRPGTANDLKQQRLAVTQQQQNPNFPSFPIGPFSPNQFKMPGNVPFAKFPMKLCPLSQYRTADNGDCASCKSKIIMEKPAIRCTAFGQGCRQLFHQECSGLTADAFTGILNDFRLEWVCKMCQRQPLCYTI